MKNKEEVITEEGFALKLYSRETKTFSIDISVETIELLKKKAKERDLSVEALLKILYRTGPASGYERGRGKRPRVEENGFEKGR